MNNKSLVLLGLLAAYSASAQSQDLCPKVACDCAALPSVAWVKECLVVEAQLKTACALNNREPKGYCGLHGPQGKPVPLAVDPNIPAPLITEPKRLAEQLATALWSLEDDAKSLEAALGQAAWPKAQSITRLMDQHLDDAFALQQQLAKQLSAGKAQDTAEQLIESYARLVPVLQRHSNGLNQPQSDLALRKSQQALSQRLQRVLGKAFEQQSLAAAGAGLTAEAAKYMTQAARLSESLVRQEQSAGNNLQHVHYYQQQGSARWYRASLYWALDRDEANAQNSRRSADALQALAGVAAD